jgi:hypothetical protein
MQKREHHVRWTMFGSGCYSCVVLVGALRRFFRDADRSIMKDPVAIEGNEGMSVLRDVIQLELGED